MVLQKTHLDFFFNLQHHIYIKLFYVWETLSHREKSKNAGTNLSAKFTGIIKEARSQTSRLAGRSPCIYYITFHQQR